MGVVRAEIGFAAVARGTVAVAKATVATPERARTARALRSAVGVAGAHSTAYSAMEAIVDSIDLATVARHSVAVAIAHIACIERTLPVHTPGDRVRERTRPAAHSAVGGVVVETDLAAVETDAITVVIACVTCAKHARRVNARSLRVYKRTPLPAATAVVQVATQVGLASIPLIHITTSVVPNTSDNRTAPRDTPRHGVTEFARTTARTAVLRFSAHVDLTAIFSPAVTITEVVQTREAATAVRACRERIVANRTLEPVAPAVRRTGEKIDVAKRRALSVWHAPVRNADLIRKGVLARRLQGDSPYETHR